METNLKIVLIIVSLYLFISTLRLIRNNKVSIKHSLIWLLSAIILFIVAVFTEGFSYISELVGFKVSANFVVGIFIVFLLSITRMLTKTVAEQNRKITLLIQEVSLLKKEINDGK